jgi:hypothetical protein
MSGRRLIGLGVLAFVFFLPLHQHFFTPASQFSKECSCYAGGRTQVGLALTPAGCLPSFQAFFIAVYLPQVFSGLSAEFESIRAPPSTFVF